MKVYGALEAAQIEWFTNAGKPAASSYPFRVIYVTDLKQIQVSDGTNWNPSALYTYTAGTLPAAGASNQYQVAFITDTLQVKVSNGTEWKTVGARLDTYTSGTIPAAASNTNSIIWVSDLQQVQVSNGSAWVQVGSKAGTKNYFSQNNANADFETNSVSPWSACTLTFSSGVPSGAPTLTATQMAISTTSTTPLSGTYSMLLTKSAANAQYQGFISGALTIDREDTAKVLYGSFYYEVVSGTIDLSGSSTQSLEIWIYNTVSGQWTQPAGYRGMNQSSGVGKVVFSFQTDGTYANNAYRIAVITQQTSTSAFVVEFDDFVVGPQAIVLGSAMTDWQSFTPVITASTTNPTIPTSGVTSHTAKWRRVGDSIELFYSYESTIVSGGNNGSGTYFFNLPPGLSIDNTKLSGSGSLNGKVAVGVGRLVTTALRSAVMFVESGNKLIMQYESAGTDLLGLDNSTSIFTTNNAYLTFTARIPVVGWGSFSQVSSDTDTRVVSSKARILSSSTITANTPIGFTTIEFDKTGSFSGSGSTFKFTAPISGVYQISSSFGANATGGGTIYVAKNGSFIFGSDGQLFAITTAGTASGSILMELNAGDYIQLACTTSVTGNTTSSVSINRLSGPSVITATETVAAAYWPTANNSTTAANPFNFDGKEYDTHNAVTTGAGWKFTAPVSGKYSVKAFLNPFSTPPSSPYFSIYKNGSLYSSIGWMTATTANCATGTIALNAGDYIDLRPNSNFQMSGNVSRSVLTNCSIQIERVGN